MKYEVVTTATAVWRIIVEADSKEQAKEKVFDGEYDSKFDIPDDFINEEVYEVNEVK
jgi:hypothetical protein